MLGLRRRQFLWLSAAACAPAGLGLAYWLGRRTEQPPTVADSDIHQVSGRLFLASHTTRALGAEVSLSALHANPATARRAVKAAVAQLDLVESLMSLYRPDSQLCRLNREHVLEQPHPALVAVLRQAEAMSRRSSGAFDVTVQPLWTLYAQARQAGGFPEPAQVRQTLRAVDWRQVEVSSQRIRLYGNETAVTLNGIAQGFAADCVMAALAAHGIEHALVNTGEIASRGDRADGGVWTIGIQHPRRVDAYLALAHLRGRCLATSGDYSTRFSDDYRDHHLFDPRTGRSPDELASVSVAAPTATLADALSTAAFVLGSEKGLHVVRTTPGADALFVFKDGRTAATAGFPTV